MGLLGGFFLKAQNCFLVRRSHTLTVGVNMMVSLQFLFELFFNEFKKQKNWFDKFEFILVFLSSTHCPKYTYMLKYMSTPPLIFDEISITKLHLKQMLLVAINEVLG